MVQTQGEVVTTIRRRIGTRVPAQLQVQLVGATETIKCTTVNVCPEGVYVATSHIKPQRQLLRLRIALEGQAEAMDVHGMVARSVDASEAASTGQVEGMAIEFVALSAGQQEVWVAQLRRLASREQGATGGTMSQPHTQPSAAPGRGAGQEGANGARKVRTVFPVPVTEVEALWEIYEKHLPAGVMFLCTTEQLEVGARVSLRILHPTSERTYDLHGKVARVYDSPQYSGLGIALHPATIERGEAFRIFIETGEPPSS
jgi:Tfp pilus assembly protein PilZ